MWRLVFTVTGRPCAPQAFAPPNSLTHPSPTSRFAAHGQVRIGLTNMVMDPPICCPISTARGASDLLPERRLQFPAPPRRDSKKHFQFHEGRWLMRIQREVHWAAGAPVAETHELATCKCSGSKTCLTRGSTGS